MMETTMEGSTEREHKLMSEMVRHFLEKKKLLKNSPRVCVEECAGIELKCVMHKI